MLTPFGRSAVSPKPVPREGRGQAPLLHPGGFRRNPRTGAPPLHSQSKPRQNFWTLELVGRKFSQHHDSCTVTTSLTPASPGTYPVEVRYANGSKPALAGFYVASGGSTPPATAQPGFPCSPSVKCAQALPYTCACVSGRCQCN